MSDTSSKLPWIVAGALGCVALGLLGVVAIGGAVLFLGTRPQAAPAGPGVAATRGEAPRGHVSGTATNERGEPIAVPGAVVTVMIRGTSADGTRQGISVKPDATGHYDVTPPDGLYFVEAWVELTFESRRYRFMLDPTDGDPHTHRPSAEGIAKDFVWKLTGPIPGMDPARPTGHYGGGLSVVPFFGTLPPEARLSFSLAPLGPRVDGAPATPIAFETTRAALEAANNVGDWPLAKYRLTGTATLPDGSTAPLKFDGYDYDKSTATSIDIVFGPGGAGLSDNVDPVLVSVLGPGKH